MKKLLFPLVVFLPVTAFAAANNVGSCGLGSKVFEGQKGVAPQVLAVTTNGTFGNQTFAALARPKAIEPRTTPLSRRPKSPHASGRPDIVSVAPI